MAKKVTQAPKMERVTEETTANASTGATRARAAGGGGDGGASVKKETRGRKKAESQLEAINVRLPVAIFPLIENCIEESPIEFGTKADFIRRSVENELRRRGKIKKYAD